MNVVGLLAGGVGTRFKSSLPKQFLKLHEKPIIVHTIDNFIKLNVIDYIVIAVPNDFLDYTKELISKYYNTNKIKVIVGGSTRYYLKNNFKLNKDDIIMTHDAVRPFANEKIKRKY